MTYIDLDAKLRELDREKNPVQLGLRGRVYTFRAKVPFEAGLALSTAPEREDDPDGWRKGVIAFITALLVDEDQADWRKATRDKMSFPDELLYETISQLGAEYTARPTAPSTASTPGSARSGRTQKSPRSKRASGTSAA
jgi:hypothetical protein